MPMPAQSLQITPESPSLRSKLGSLLVFHGMIVTARQSVFQCAAEVRGKPFLFETESGLDPGTVRNAHVFLEDRQPRLRIWVNCADIAYFEPNPLRKTHSWMSYRRHHSGQYVQDQEGILTFD